MKPEWLEILDIQWSTDNFDYEFFGKKIFNTGELQKLLKSKNDDATLRLDQGRC